jgi:ABC-type Fe3+/spermidine/putrescine transport system ATPase subunit
MAHVLRIANVSKNFYGLKAVRDVSLDAPSSAVTAVIGPNGAGKTTLFNCVTGVFRPDVCHSRLYKRDGRSEPIAGKTPEELCRLGISRTFQQVRLFDSLSVVDNVMLATLVQHPMPAMAAVADRLLNSARRQAYWWMTDPKILVLALLSRTLHNLKGVAILTQHRLAVEARVLARCCYENLFMVGGLHAEGVEFAKQMVGDDQAGRKGRIEATLDATSKSNRGAKPAPFPGFIEPAIAALRGKVPSGPGYIHEVKPRRLPRPSDWNGNPCAPWEMTGPPGCWRKASTVPGRSAIYM